MYKILLLEDDELLGDTLEEELSEQGFNITWVKDSDSAAEACYTSEFDLYLFDVNVPGQNGFELLYSLREASDETPTIFLTARTSLKDLQEGFNVGASDYVTKPFEMAVLLIRINAKIKNFSHLSISKESHLDTKKQLLHVDDKKINLPKREFEILSYYLTHKDRIINKDEILEILYEGDFISDSTYRVYMKNINSYLKGHAKLNNVRGAGYRFELL